MNPDIFSEWLRRQDYVVVKTASSYWYDAWPRVFQAYPYHWVIQPDQEEIERLLWRALAGETLSFRERTWRDYASFVERFNADLANALGNTASRTLSMAARYLAGRVPEPSGEGPVPAAPKVLWKFGPMSGSSTNGATTSTWTGTGWMSKGIPFIARGVRPRPA